MTRSHPASQVAPSNPNRRKFLVRSCAAISTAAVSFGALPGRAQQSAPPADAPNISPGYVGPEFFDKKEEAALLEVLNSGSPFRYTGPGKPVKVQEFEDAFARHMGTPYALAVSSGTAALDCAIAALGVGPGDEVIVPAYTWWSDYTCVVHSGALPVFADIDRTLNLDPRDFERKITPRTKAVIAVHLLGGPADMGPILDIARSRKIAVVEDCAQCVGGSYQGKRLGSLGDIGIYSFQINKMITAGEGGAVVTSNPLFYERATRFHDMGMARPVFINRIGQMRAQNFAGENFRMNEFSGAVLGAQLPKLDTMLSQLRKNAQTIYDGIAAFPGIRLRKRPDPAGDIGTGVFFEAKDKAGRDAAIKELRSRKVPASTLSGSVLLPMEESVINKRTRNPNWPSFTSEEGKKIQYGPECCAGTREVYDRFVQVRIGTKYTDRINQYIIAAIRAVL